MSSLVPDGVVGDGQARAFLVQYLTLMLLILTMTIGSYSRADLTKLANRAAVAKEAAAKSGSDIPAVPTQFVLPHLMLPTGDEPFDVDAVAALVSVINAHDIRLQLTVPGESLEQSIGRTLSLTQALLNAGAPSDSFETLATASSTDSEVRARVLPLESKP